MTAEEMERSIEFLLKNQATLESQLERTSRQIEETNKRLEAHAETQTEFIQIVTRHVEAQGEINASMRAALSQTDARLDRLAALVEQHIGGNQ
jgi:hypothetical protein